MVTKGFLESKTNDELRTICSDRGITGMSKQPKAVLIDVILNDMQSKAEIPTRESLNTKTPVELQQMCEERGMTGLTRQPKNILVELLLNDFAKDALLGLEGKLIVEKDDDGEITTTIKISCGGSQDMFPVVGRTIEEVMDILTEALNLPDDPMVVVNGTEITDMNYVLQSGDELDFVQKADDKGDN